MHPLYSILFIRSIAGCSTRAESLRGTARTGPPTRRLHRAALPRLTVLHAKAARVLLQSKGTRDAALSLQRQHRLCLDALGWPAPTSRCGSARCALLPSADRSR